MKSTTARHQKHMTFSLTDPFTEAATAILSNIVKMNLANHIPTKEKLNIHEICAIHKNHNTPIQIASGRGVPNIA